MEILLVLVTGALCVACFFVGAKVGQAVSRGEDIKLPKLDPMKPFRDHQDRKKAEAEQERYEAILRNVESYDGTGAHQEDVPRG